MRVELIRDGGDGRMSVPFRLRFERKKGFRLQALSLATNAVPAGREKAAERFLCETVPTLDLASSPCGLC